MTRDMGFSGEYKRLVLVVDDESINRQMLGFIISSDYEVIYAENGLHALDLIHANKERLSLILLDLKMPQLDGFGVMRELKKDSVLAGIPVIVLTAEKSWEVEALDLGAADFIPKPYDQPEVILARIRRTIQLAEDSMIMRKAERDPLTGLYARYFFFSYAREWNLYYPYLEMDAVALRLSHFSFIKKVYGQEAADGLLKETAEQISAYLEANNGLACRLEEDLFLLYTPHMGEAQPIKDHFFTRRPWAEAFPNVYHRVGICTVKDQAGEVESCFAKAGQACALAKPADGADGEALCFI